MTKKVLVTGANGQLGNCIQEISANYPNYKFIFTDVDTLDITDRSAVISSMESIRPDWVINTAAYTAVDAAESNIEAATLLNSDAVKILAEESEKIGASLIQISTDYVFKGNNPTALKEDEPTNPNSIYGQTKLAGELATRANKKSVIIRTSWLYSIYGNNFVKTMLHLCSEREEVNVVSDQWGSPTSAHDLAYAIMEVVKKPVYETFHFSNEGTTNWALFTEQIIEDCALECKVNHISTSDYPTAAKRPEFSILCKNKFSKTFNFLIPEWEYSLEKVLDKLNIDPKD